MIMMKCSGVFKFMMIMMIMTRMLQASRVRHGVARWSESGPGKPAFAEWRVAVANWVKFSLPVTVDTGCVLERSPL
jgi:hypothetical protein